MTHPERPAVAGPVLVAGFGVALALWCAAFLVHMPWLDLPGRVGGPILLVAWAVAAVAAGRSVAAYRPLLLGAAGGLVTALVCLLILGTALVEQPTAGDPAPGAGGLRPSMLAYVPAFLALGMVIGLAGALVGSRLPGSTGRPGPDWLFRFAVLTAVALLALLVLGGAVTSTDSGMAIRGWPSSDAANLFLYPLSLMADPRRFLEHSHRLFGTFVGLCTIVLTVYTWAVDRRVAPRAATAVLLAAVIGQGVLGGLRVIENNRPLGIAHGVAAQAIFGFAACLAAVLSPTYKSAVAPLPTPGRWRGVTSILLAVLLIQVVLGAAFRHLKQVSPGAMHALYTHIVFSIFVVIMALVAGFTLIRAGRRGAPVLKRSGTGLVHTVGLQFLLGWVAFAAIMLSPTKGQPPAEPGGGPIEVPAWEAIVATGHQTFGALLVALSCLAWLWSRRLLTKAGPSAG